LTSVLALSHVTAAEPADKDLALGKPYTLHPAPNYIHCTDPGDVRQLTDGQTTDAYFWTQTGTVGWRVVPYAMVTVDLGRIEPIDGVAFRTAAGRAGVQWPGAIRILTSDDGKAYRDAGDLVALDHAVNGSWPEDYAIRRLVARGMQTRGRFVRFLILPSPDSPYTFVDEVEVFRGPAHLLEGPARGEPVGEMGQMFAKWRIEQGVRRRFEVDIAGVEAAIDDTRLLGGVIPKLRKHSAGAAAELRASHVAADRGFRVELPLNKAHARLFLVSAALWKARKHEPLTWCVVPPLDLLDPYAVPDPLPGGEIYAKEDPFHPSRILLVQPGGRVEVHLVHGERRSAAVNLANSTDGPMKLLVEPSPSLRRFGCRVSIRSVAWTDTSQGRAVAAAIEDCPIVDGAAVVNVLPGLVRQVWLDFRVDVPPKDRLPAMQKQKLTGSLWIRRDGAEREEIPVEVHVYPIDFPEQTTLLLGGWSYTNGNGRYGITAANRTALVRHLQQRHVNCPWATSSVMMRCSFDDDGNVQFDTTEFDDWITQWPDARRYMVFLSVPNHFGGAKIGTPQFDARVAAWIKAWVRHLQAKGIAPDRLGLLLTDEPNERKEIDALLAWAKAIRTAEPEVLIWQDPTYRDPAKAPAELFAASDVLCPNRPMWLAEGEPFARFYREQREQGRELQLYSCSGPARLLDPYSYYRLQAWHCWKIGATGSFFWAFGDNGGASSWNPYLAKAGPYTPLFLDATSVVAGKQMEAIRESAQDYEYLLMLRDAIERAKTAGREDAAVTEAESLLNSAADEVLSAEGADRLKWHEPKDRTIADQVRVRILESLTALQAE